MHESDLRTDATTDEVVAPAAERAALFLPFFFRDSGNDQLEDLTNDVVHRGRDGKNISPEDDGRTISCDPLIVLYFMGLGPNLEAPSMRRTARR